MLYNIIRKLTAIKNTNEITRKQLLLWARRVGAQRVHKTFIEATKENKRFDAMKE